MGYFDWILIGVGTILQLLAISAMVPSVWRRLPFLFAYILSCFLGGMVQVAAVIDLGGWTKDTAKLYWTSSAASQILLFATLAAFLIEAMRDQPFKWLRGSRLIAVFCAFAGISLWYHHQPHLTRWLTLVSRDLSFASIFLNLTLWMALIRRKNSFLLSICAALGMQMAGEAIGQSLRQISRETVAIGNYVIVGTYMLSLLLLCRILRRMKGQDSSAHGAMLAPVK